jgi:DNA repair photolyase
MAAEIPPSGFKGRGALANPGNRFNAAQREHIDDGWFREDLPASIATEVRPDASRSVIARNDSPDIPFAQSINPYRGCEHGCIYCYARPTHAYLGLSPGLDFETQIFHKPAAPQLLRETLSRSGYACSTIVVGTATDAYQPFERQQRLTRALLEIMLEARHPVSVITKSSLILRDIDLLAELARHKLAHVGISLTTVDGALARQLEPRASAPQARLAAIRKLSEAGIPVSVFVSPLIPGLTDHELEKLLAAAQEHGAQSASYALLRLPHEVAGLFREWLEWHAPEKMARIMAVLYDLRGGRLNDARFGSRMTGLGHYAELIRQRFDLACRRCGLSRELPLLDTTLFRPPAPPKPANERQLSLF